MSLSDVFAGTGDCRDYGAPNLVALERVTRLVSQPATMRTTLERIAYSSDAVLLERLARTRGFAN